MMVGDKLNIDMKMAQTANITGALIQMGEYDPESQSKFPEIKPEFSIQTTEKLLNILN